MMPVEVKDYDFVVNKQVVVLYTEYSRNVLFLPPNLIQNGKIELRIVKGAKESFILELPEECGWANLLIRMPKTTVYNIIRANKYAAYAAKQAAVG